MTQPEIPTSAPVRRPVAVVTADALLDGVLELPAAAVGLVLFAHGSGSSRHSPRNRDVARVLHEARIGTLLFDLLTREEAERDAFDRSLRFDIELLADRLIGAIDWVAGQREVAGLPLGLFGASTGAAAALVAAAARPERIAALVARGGRPDLAGDALAAVRVPTLLLVGALDAQVLALNQRAHARLRGHAELRSIAGASHLFEEPGTLEQVAVAAAEFFARAFTSGRPQE